MKRGTLHHYKTELLAETLGVDLCTALGLVEGLCNHWAPVNAITGDLTKFDPGVIAKGIGWRREDGGRMVDALVSSGWLDRSGTGRLVIHDWLDHCDEACRKKLARLERNGGQRRTTADAVQTTADGVDPPRAGSGSGVVDSDSALDPAAALTNKAPTAETPPARTASPPAASVTDAGTDGYAALWREKYGGNPSMIQLRDALDSGRAQGYSEADLRTSARAYIARTDFQVASFKRWSQGIGSYLPRRARAPSLAAVSRPTPQARERASPEERRKLQGQLGALVSELSGKVPAGP